MKRARFVSEERDFRSVKNVVKAEIRTELKKRIKVCTIVGLDDDTRSLEEQIYAKEIRDSLRR